MTRAAWAIAVGVMLTVGAGCHHPRPYAPNYGAYPTYPTYPTAPAGGYPAAPGGSYIVPNQTIPGTLGPTTPYPTNGPTMAPPLNGGGNAPPATYEGGTNPSGGVPDYRDPTTGDFGTAPSGDGFQAPAEETPFMEGQGTAVPSPNGYASAAPSSSEHDYFAELSEYEMNRPGGAAPAPSSTGVQPAGYEKAAAGQEMSVDEAFAAARPGPLGAAQQSSAATNPDWYGYDPNGYRWLRGVVNYDPQSQEWFIMYGLPPEKGERYGGALTLANHPLLKNFKNNDVVEVRGQIDPSAGQDIQGKPYYRIESAKLLGRYE